MQSFNNKVYALCKRIPKGKVATYGEIARKLHSKGFQAVGQALHNNPYAPVVPCHRIVNAKGFLHGFAFGLEKKKKLLEAEGVEVIKGKVDLKKFGYRFKDR